LIESWFGKLNQREVWPNEYETIDDARRGIGGYVDRYHHRPHPSLDYRTPLEVRQTWEDLQGLQKPRPRLSTPAGSRSLSGSTRGGTSNRFSDSNCAGLRERPIGSSPAFFHALPAGALHPLHA
jgi:hypothetical protein